CTRRPQAIAHGAARGVSGAVPVSAVWERVSAGITFGCSLKRLLLHPLYLHGCSCLHAEMRNVCPRSPPSQPENGQSATIFGSTATSMGTPKSGIVSNCSNL